MLSFLRRIKISVESDGSCDVKLLSAESALSVNFASKLIQENERQTDFIDTDFYLHINMLNDEMALCFKTLQYHI